MDDEGWGELKEKYGQAEQPEKRSSGGFLTFTLLTLAATAAFVSIPTFMLMSGSGFAHLAVFLLFGVFAAVMLISEYVLKIFSWKGFLLGVFLGFVVGMGLVVLLMSSYSPVSMGDSNRERLGEMMVSRLTAGGLSMSSTISGEPAAYGAPGVKLYADSMNVEEAVTVDVSTGKKLIPAEAGMKLVTIDLRMVNDGEIEISSPASHNLELVTDDGSVYNVFSALSIDATTADLSSYPGCNQLGYTESDVAPGETKSGCYIFQIPEESVPVELKVYASSVLQIPPSVFSLQ